MLVGLDETAALRDFRSGGQPGQPGGAGPGTGRDASLRAAAAMTAPPEELRRPPAAAEQA